MVPTNQSQAKLFDKKFVALALRNVNRCDKCKREYDIKFKCSASDNKPNSSRPVLLNCGHNICENCIYQNRHNAECAVCRVPIELENTRWLKRSYDLNFFLLGQLTNSKSFLSSENNLQTGHVAGAMLAQEMSVHKCSECEQAAAIGLCLQCQVEFCKRCFTSVHQNSKVLKKHKLSEYETQTLQLELPKEKFCKIHKRLCDKFCLDCKGVFCTVCIKTTHSTHHFTALAVENENQKDKIISFMETMKQTRENIRNAQTDARICQNRMEDFATEVILEVSDHFLELHNYLQLEERRILEVFKNSARSSQKTIHEAFAKLSDCQTTLNNMRSSLEGYIRKPPHNIHIDDIIEVATNQLEQIPCQIQISDIEKNPFIFKKLKDTCKAIRESCEINALDTKISIRITPMYGDHLTHSLEICSDRSNSPDQMSLTRLNSIDICRPSTMSNSSLSIVAIGKSKRVCRVTSIISPAHFFIQDDDVMSEVRIHLADIDGNSNFVESIKVGEMYLVYHVTDKVWYRGIIKEKKKHSKDKDGIKYKVYFVDYGTCDEILKKWLREIHDKAKSIPAAAVACRLIDLGPAGEAWSSESRDLMEEIIQNKPVQVIIQDTTKSPWKVDIFTSHSSAESISLRDALLYTGLGIDTSIEVSQRSLKFTGTKPKQVSKIKNRITRPMLQSGECFRVKITHVENPQQFFAVKFAYLADLAKLETEMDLEYSKQQSDTIYYAKLHMCCALFVEEKWYRGCVEEINDPNSIRVRLVDDGRSVTVNWRQLHILNERFTRDRELSIECSLADVQPLQVNDYEWTDTAIAEFVRMTSNPNIQMTISSSSQFRYQVILNVIKNHLDVNIGAMLVKFNHALTTGEGSTVIGNLKGSKSTVEHLLIPGDKCAEATASVDAPTPTIRTLVRTPIQVVHINNPGEFYMHLVEHIPGILKFHEELHLAQEKKREQGDIDDDNEWKLNDHCMVFTTINVIFPSNQWYRGVIQDIDTDDSECIYAVFLRDRGIIIRDLRKSQISPIDGLFDRVCNAAILCHLACVHPTGGVKNWSYSSIEEFAHNVKYFESLAATIQGTVKNGSIPVVLWGKLTETNDPLAPCTNKYTNINKVLVCAGLAHLTEKIDITRQMDKFIQAELEQGQQSLQEWYENFKKIEELPVDLCETDDSLDDNSFISSYEIAESLKDCGIATEWLPAVPIEKTVFTGFPTYVDDEAIVYLHDAEKHSLLAKMRAKINQEIELKPPLANISENWGVGQPCLARYHLDNSLYRAIICRPLKDKKYEVRFIDYGNIEACEARDLYRMTAFPNIPIQAIRFRIDGIRPKGGQATFSTTVLDLIHGVIVDKLCAIRVPSSEAGKEIKKCSIRFDRNNLATYLIQNGFACGVGNRKTRDTPSSAVPKLIWPFAVSESVIEKSNSDDDLREFMKHQICDPTEGTVVESAQPIPKKNTNVLFNSDEYERIFQKMQAEKLYKSATDADSDISLLPEDAAESDDDIVELEFSFRSNYWHMDENPECAPSTMPKSEVGSNFDNFEPLDSSSLLSNFSGIEAFKAPQLPSSVKSFYCDVAYIRSPTILHIFPHLSELEYRQVELARRIQLMVRKIPELTTFEVKMPCLARYSKDKLWYRAIIRSYDAITHQVQVFYVDFLNTEQVREEYVRKCPKDLLSWPLRTFEMKLFELKPNPRLREKDVKRAIKKCCGERTLYAKIMRERGKIMEICLFKSKAEKDAPIYEDLIAENYFCQE